MDQMSSRPMAALRRLEASFADWLTPWRCRVYPRTIALLLGIAFGVSLLVGPGITDVSRTIVGADFSAFWIGGRMVLEGRASELYYSSAQKRRLDQLIAPVKTDLIHPFVNPPFYAVAMVPLARLPYLGALALWWGFGLGCLLLTARWLRAASFPERPLSLRESLLLPWLFFPTIIWFLYGQNSALSLALLTAWLLGLRRGRDVAAGLALGLLFFKPQLGLGPVIVMLAARRWRGIAAAAVTAGLWTALGYLAVPGAMRDYLRVAPLLFDFLRSSDYNTWGIISLFGFATNLCDDLSRGLGSALALLLSAASALAIWGAWQRTAWTPGSRSWDLRMAATTALGIIMAPHLFLYDATLLLLPLALMIGRVPAAPGRVLDHPVLLARTGLLYACLFLGPYAVMVVRAELHRFGWPAPVPQPATIAALLWIAAVYAESRRPDQPQA